MWWAILITAVLTGFFTLVFLNLRPGERQIRYQLIHRFAVNDPQFRRCMGQLLGPGILPGNRITALHNGGQIFPAMLGAIRATKTSITFETYICWSGEISRKFSAAFCERARAGVKIHVMLDWAGSGEIEATYLDDLQAAGVEMELYHPLSWYHLTRLNNRTHRKLLVVDGRTGFTGGVGIADQWLRLAEDQDHWRDSHYQIDGPAMAQMQAAFTDNWINARAQVLFARDYFPSLEPAGDSWAQVFKSSRGGDSESMCLMYLLTIASAIRFIRLQAAYFVPDDLAIATFVSARRRNVKIEIMVPGPAMDARMTQHAGRSRWGVLLDAGVEIYEDQSTMYHCKVLIVDDVWGAVGSTNFDDRSFRLNDEANLNIYDATFAEEQVKVFEHDKSRSRLMTRAEFKDRSTFGRLGESLAGMFRRQL
jgi:cardiolipin synthase A/B